MSNYVDVFAIVEGQTEFGFIKNVLAPYMGIKNVGITPIIIDKPGEKGGDVKFARAKNDIERQLKQRSDTFITLMVDYYGINSDWPGYRESKQKSDYRQKAEIINQSTLEKVKEQFHTYQASRRFIPYVSMHEIEALYFSEPMILAEKLGIAQTKIDAILVECGEPEKINDHYNTAPSKRLEALCKRFKKTTTGLAIAETIGVETMRAACPIFDGWLNKLESLSS